MALRPMLQSEIRRQNVVRAIEMRQILDFRTSDESRESHRQEVGDRECSQSCKTCYPFE